VNEGQAPWTISANGTFLMPGSADAMSWRIGDHGFRMTLSPRVPDLINTHLKSWLEGWLAQEGLGLEDVATWAIHPGGPRILTAVEEALSLQRSATAVSREVLAEHGNMSSATILFILERLRAQGAPRPLVAMAFGPGLVVEAALIR
jgi:predicted naringenin-chalcone synthase